jgi:hypothetical protein
MNGTTPAGWYPDSQNPGQQRYWDGTQWTEHFAPIASAPAPAAVPIAAQAPAPGTTPKKESWFLRHKVLSAVLALFVIGVIASAADGGASEDSPVAANTPTGSASAKSSPAPTDTSSPTPTEPTKTEPVESVSQANARQSAEGYLDYSAFSREGLIKQLKFEGYSLKDATYGADSVHANWNAQAARAAQDYLDYSPFSREGLIEQLMFEGYTRKQAEYGVNKVGL